MIKKPKIIADIINIGAKINPSSIAIVCEENIYSYSDLDEITDIIASNLLKRGISKGSKVAINGPNIPEWLFTYLALAKIGAVTVALNIRYRENELKFMLNQSDTCVLISIGFLKSPFGDFDFAAYFQSLRTQLPNIERYFYIGRSCEGAEMFEDLLEQPSPSEKTNLIKAKKLVNADDPLMIIYTSGTTGEPKGAVLTHQSQIASAYGQLNRIPIDANDSLVLSLPLNHVGGITSGALYLLMARGKIVLQRVFIPGEMSNLCKKHKTTIMGGVTSMYSYIFRESTFQKEMLKTVRLSIVGGANVEPDLMEQIKLYIPNSKIFNSYGLTESSGGVVQSTLNDDSETLLRSIGRPIDGQDVKIVDETLKEVPVGVVGELFVIGDCVGAGYYNWPEATNEAFVQKGVLTGDVGYVDELGYIYLKGRKKEMYIQGGYNIYPAEIENILVQHPKVFMAAGIGIPDQVMGEIGQYYILPASGCELSSDELKSYLKENIANYKVPKNFVFVKELPLTPAGKVQKKVLKERYEKSGKPF